MGNKSKNQERNNFTFTFENYATGITNTMNLIEKQAILTSIFDDKNHI